jgi:hypothetical protein
VSTDERNLSSSKSLKPGDSELAQPLLYVLSHKENTEMNNTSYTLSSVSELNTLSLDDLASVNGGLTRDQFVQGGRHAGEIGTLAAGAAGGAWMGGPGGAALGTAAAEAANRTGVPADLGGRAAGAVWDAGAAVGQGAQNLWNRGRQALGF